MTPERRSDAGLSLIEVLVSLAIFAVIGIAGLAMLNTVARTGERTDGRLDRLAQIDRAFLVIRRDLAQANAGGITLSDDALAVNRSVVDSSISLGFEVADTTLIRRVKQPDVSAVAQKLLTGIATADWRVMDRARRWHEVWPPVGATDAGRLHAAELRLEVWRAEVETPQSVTRLFVLPAGQGR